MLSKKLQGIIKRNVMLFPGPNLYTLHQSKHIPNGYHTLNDKLDEIKKYAERNYGECYATSEQSIKGSQLQMNFYMVCGFKACDEFENAVKGA